MSKKALVVILVVVILILNQFLTKSIDPVVQIPETAAVDVVDYILLEDSVITGPNEEYLVVKVIDGDTIEVNIDGQIYKVRYIGIDTPETIHSGRPVGCFSSEATLRNQQLVLGQKVQLIKDVNETDKYGRLLRYVYVGETFINLSLVSEGFAKVATYPPDVKYAKNFRGAEKIAREGKIGLWGEVCNK